MSMAILFFAMGAVLSRVSGGKARGGSGLAGHSLSLFFHVALFRDRKIGAALFKKIFFYRIDPRRTHD